MTRRTIQQTTSALALMAAAYASSAQSPASAPATVALLKLAAAASTLQIDAAPMSAPVEEATTAPESNEPPAASGASPSSAASAPPSSSPSSDASAELAPPDPAQRSALESRLKALDAAGLADDDKHKAAEYYQEALASFDAATEQTAAAVKFQAELAHAKKGRRSTEETAARLAAPIPADPDPASATLSDIETWADDCEKSLGDHRTDLATMVAEPKRRSQRMADLPGLVADAEKKLKQAADDFDSLGGEDAGDAIAAAHRAALTYAQLEAKAALAAFAAEEQLYDQTGDWVRIRRDYLARCVPHEEKRLAQLREVIKERRASEAAERARQATVAAGLQRPKAVSDLAEDNKTLADDGADVTEHATEVTKDLDETRALLAELSQKFDQAQEQAGQLSTLGGQMLREQQSKLPDAPALRRNSTRREALLSDVLLHIYDLNDQRSALANLDDVVEAIAARSATLTDAQRAEIRELLTTKRDTLDRLIDDYGKYSTRLNELHSEEAKLIDVTESYASFIAERVLWIKSCAVPTPSDWSYAARGFTWSIDPHHWYKAGMAMVTGSGSHPLACCAYFFFLLMLGVAHAPARRRLSELGEEARKRDCQLMAPTLKALVATLVIALPWPALLTLLSWSLDPLSISEFVRSLGVALRLTAVCLLLLEMARTICRPGGLGDAHFNWPSACLAQFRRKLHLLELIGAPLLIWIAALEVQGIEPRWSPALGRGLFVLFMLLLAVSFERLLMAARSPFRQLVVVGRSGWLAPLQVVWRPVVTLLPLALAGLALAGYYYTAQQAALRILQSAALVLGVLTLGAVIRRWLLISHRRLAREQAQKRRAQLAAESGVDISLAPPAELIDDAIDLAALSEQTQKLVHMVLAVTMVLGLMLIWAAILPALQYPAKHLLPGAETLTWGNLAAFSLILAVTYITVRDVPAMLELVILRHLPIDCGTRYAFTTITRYVLSSIGVFAAFRAIGGDWSKIQWLVAAMSLGLGFGLQEIFANFVSGIILLFERPIRVGDVVTLGDKSGVVTRIRMRATTIVDPDRKEYIVPNKDLVTERILNWTLSDHTNRIEVVVNVANGTDTDLACKLLLEAAHEQPHLLGEPAPVALFEGFTDNGLKLVLRCFLPSLEHRSSTIHALHTAIDRKFRASSIDGAFGDLRIRVAREAVHNMQGSPKHMAFVAGADGKRKADADRQGAA